MSELIEKLKNNEKPFGLLSEEEQECLRKVNENYGVEMYLDGKWGGAEDGDKFEFTFIHNSYRIKPDYQPEPEYGDYEIETHCSNGLLHIHYKGGNVKALHDMIDIPDFRGFYIDGCFNTRIDIQDVAELISKGQKVVARFVK